MAKVQDLMVSGAISIRPGATVHDAAVAMANNHVGAVLIVEHDILEGVFSERDLLTRVIAAGKDPNATTVAAVATKDVVTVKAEDGIQAALEAFRKANCRHLPVVDGKRPIGILCTRDLLNHSVGALEKYVAQLRYNRELAEGVDPYDHFGGSYSPV